MQTNWNSVRCKFKIMKTLGCGIWESGKENERCSIQGQLGSLMYAMVTRRANITFAMSTVNRFMLKIGLPYWMAMIHILRYLQGILYFRLRLGGKDITLRGFCNADWTGDTNDQQFITGYVFFVSVVVISWKYKKQPSIAFPTVEGEYMASSHCTKKTVWFR